MSGWFLGVRIGLSYPRPAVDCCTQAFFWRIRASTHMKMQFDWLMVMYFITIEGCGLVESLSIS